MSARKEYLRIEDVEDVTVVRLLEAKILDEQHVEVLGFKLISLVVDSDCAVTRLVLDFSPVQLMSAAFLGKLATLNYKIREKGGLLVLCYLHQDVAEVFEITKLNRCIPIFLQRWPGSRDPPLPV